MSRSVEPTSQSHDVKMGSERGFGIVFAVVFALIGLWPLLDGAPVRIWALAIGGGFLVAGFVVPVLLRPLNKVWFWFGMALGRIMTPLVMGLLFFTTVTPIALIMRVLGKDPLKLKPDAQANSYWIPRTPPGPEKGSLKNQF